MRALSCARLAIATLAALALVAGCTGTDAPPTTAAHTATSGADGPTTIPTRLAAQGAGRTLSTEEQALLASDLASDAEFFGITDPPHVDIVRVVDAVDYAKVQVDCLHDEGFPQVTLGANGTSWEVEFPNDDQNAAYHLAGYICAAKYPRDPAQNPSRMTREQKLVAYDYLTRTLVDCLREHGFTISGIPSQETFLATWDTNRWNPYNQLGSSGMDTDLIAACPQNTPQKLIWGN